MKSLEELKAIKAKMQDKVVLRKSSGDIRIVVGMATCGIAAGAMSAYEILNSKLDLSKNQLTVTGCIGMCYLEPIVDVYADDELHRFVKVNGEIAEKIALAINENDLSQVKDFEISDDDKQFLGNRGVQTVIMILSMKINENNIYIKSLI